jgi:hypothetical protein
MMSFFEVPKGLLEKLDLLKYRFSGKEGVRRKNTG